MLEYMPTAGLKLSCEIAAATFTATMEVQIMRTLLIAQKELS
jgi:hypothetical protein